MIPVNEPILDGNEKKYLAACVNTGWISSEGPFVAQFEDMFASFVGVKHGVAVANGTAALEAALHALGVTKGDQVIMPSFTIISCAIACLRLGAVPVLVDIDPETWTMDTAQIESKITERTKAIMAVHIYGHPVDMDALFRLKEAHGLKIIEDMAEAHGARYFSPLSGGQWLNCGAMGDIAAVSFYANKIVTTGEGGMVITDNPEYAHRARSYRNLCFMPEKRFYHEEIGYNFRMTNLQAAVGVAQLEQIDRFIRIKKRLGERYDTAISELDGIRFMSVKPWADSVYWMYGVQLDPEAGVPAERMMSRLKRVGVGTRPFFRGMHAQPALRELGLFENEIYPVTDRVHTYGFYLPSGLTLREEDIQVVVNALNDNWYRLTGGK